MNGGSKQVLSVFSPGQAGLAILRRILVGAVILTFLLLWWSGWKWFPAVIWLVVPMIAVVLPGIRRMVDESWGLVVGLVLCAFSLTEDVPGALVAVAWGLAIAAVAGLVLLKGGLAGWRKWVPITALSIAGILVLTGEIVWIIGANARKAEAARLAEQSRQYNVSKLLPTSPRDAVFALVEGVTGTEKAENVCTVFSPVAAAQFAVAHRAADCAGAFATLRGQIRNERAYVTLWIPTQESEKSLSPPGQPRQLDACGLKFGNALSGEEPDAGPQLGKLTFVQQFGAGWLITDYRPCEPPG
ncbi:hypothetical protein [Amycolatopsis thailandensis]|uniref:hypothetical protein n=1 Tax=Amycolatopsis thailandensis TaxID=589330 RepID=UPI003639F19D